MKKNTEGYVYFIRNKETKAIKIGYSVNPKKRIKQLSTGSSSVLDLIYVIEGSKDVEYFLHRYFASERVNLEWFDEELVLQWIQNDKITSNYLQKEQGLEDKMG